MELCWLAVFQHQSLEVIAMFCWPWGNGLSVHSVTRRHQARQSPERRFVAGLLDGQALVPLAAVFFVRVQAEIFSSGPQKACPTTFIAVRCAGFFSFCIIGSTERKMVITSEFIGMGRPRVIQGSSRFIGVWSTEEDICLDID